MALQYLLKIVPCVLLLLSGLLISGDPTAKRQIVSLLAHFGMANDDDEVSIENSATILVRILYVLSFILFVWCIVFFWHHHRKLSVRPLENQAIPYQSHTSSEKTQQPAESQPPASPSSPNAPSTTRPQKSVKPLTTTMRTLSMHVNLASLDVTHVGERLPPI